MRQSVQLPPAVPLLSAPEPVLPTPMVVGGALMRRVLEVRVGGCAPPCFAVRVAFALATRECECGVALDIGVRVVAETPEGVDLGVVVSLRVVEVRETPGVEAVCREAGKPLRVCPRVVVPASVPAGWRVLRVLRVASPLDIEGWRLLAHEAVRAVECGQRLLADAGERRVVVADAAVQLDRRRLSLVIRRPSRAVRADLAALERASRAYFTQPVHFEYEDQVPQLLLLEGGVGARG